MILIENGRCINPAFKQDEIIDILIKDNKIIKMGKHLLSQLEVGEKEKCKIIDATNKIIAPGLVDVHVHFREPGFERKEDIMTGSMAAARGGYTSVVLMANTFPVVDNIETLQYVLAKGKETKIHIYTCATITKKMAGKEVVDMQELKRAGAIGFTDDGLPIMEEDVLRKAMEYSAQLQMPISLHEEDPSLIHTAGIHDGEVATSLGLQGATREAEITMVARDIQLAKETGAILNVQHISAKETVDLLREIRKSCKNIHGEATPHHFALTQEAVLEHNTLAKMNPPLRVESDRKAIIQGLKDNVIEIIATDHAPHTAEEKKREFAKAPSGILGLETALSLGIMYLVKSNELTWMELFEKMSYNPAKLYDIDGGVLEIGGCADLIILDENEKWNYAESFSKASNSPFLGKEMQGKVIYTICAGKIVYSENDK